MIYGLSKGLRRLTFHRRQKKPLMPKLAAYVEKAGVRSENALLLRSLFPAFFERNLDRASAEGMEISQQIIGRLAARFRGEKGLDVHEIAIAINTFFLAAGTPKEKFLAAELSRIGYSRSGILLVSMATGKIDASAMPASRRDKNRMRELAQLKRKTFHSSLTELIEQYL